MVCDVFVCYVVYCWVYFVVSWVGYFNRLLCGVFCLCRVVLTQYVGGGVLQRKVLRGYVDGGLRRASLVL